ncbi:hypothetical protein SUGI_0386920 [Cryptomeria japonica]|uniref:acidic endochitinase-like n=1 Tax=Cryptomeria japonica TaxID=3369 RepID=UPI00240893DB|nr:acidic endochitinase-like [Cryptomeria japonica]GLJ21152.1 hypothetical protein SUGI_0386920 [Cryptomeria japonica]
MAEQLDRFKQWVSVIPYQINWIRRPTPDHLPRVSQCDPSSGGCQSLSTNITSCQSRGVEVFLSLGGENGNCGLGSTQDAGILDNYLWNNFLGGQSESRPLGPAVLDGIDFSIHYTTTEHWDFLAKALSARTTVTKKVYLSALPHCQPPIQSDLTHTQQSAQWILTVKTTQKQNFFLGIPASTKATFAGGFIPANALISEVLPEVKESVQYGGVMLWNEFYDDKAHYSMSIKGFV